jgi:hypothetical protein
VFCRVHVNNFYDACPSPISTVNYWGESNRRFCQKPDGLSGPLHRHLPDAADPGRLHRLPERRRLSPIQGRVRQLSVVEGRLLRSLFTAILALLAGFTQFSPVFLQDHRRLHRLIGRLCAYDILFVNFPVGMVLALCENGLLPGRIAFVLLDSLWFTFTLFGVLAARRGQFSRHRAMMTRSYALTFSAITLRTWKYVLVRATHIDPTHLYMIDAWMGFAPNLAVAEWWIRSHKRRRPRSSALNTNIQCNNDGNTYKDHEKVHDKSDNPVNLGMWISRPDETAVQLAGQVTGREAREQ